MQYNTHMAEIVVVHGAPGSGKTTHSEKLSHISYKDRPVLHISAGDRIRDIRLGEANSVHEDIVKDPNAPFLLQDHSIVNGIVFEYVSECPSNSIVLIDGYPRFAGAISVFTESIHKGGHKLLGCINLNISQETCISRLAIRGVRKGERTIYTGNLVEKAIRRYSEYVDYTMVAVEEFGKITSIVSIDAEPNVEVVWQSFSEAFTELVK